MLTTAIEPGKFALPMNVGIDYNLIDINIAMGEGSKAGLSAFEYLMLNS